MKTYWSVVIAKLSLPTGASTESDTALHYNGTIFRKSLTLIHIDSPQNLTLHNFKATQLTTLNINQILTLSGAPVHVSNFIMAGVRTQAPNPVSLDTKGVFVWSHQSDARVYNATVLDSEFDSVFYVYAEQALDVQLLNIHGSQMY